MIRSTSQCVWRSLVPLVLILILVSSVGCADIPVPAAVGTPLAPAAPTAAPQQVTPVEPTLSPTATSVPPQEAVHPAVLDPLSIPKYVDPLVVPPVMPAEGRRTWNGEGEEATEYRIAVRQFEQQVLPTGFPKTTVWGYGRMGDPLPGPNVEFSSFNFPGFTVEARTNERVRVVWVNQLVDDPDNVNPRFLPHIVPVDQTLHWANPGGVPGSHGLNPEPYVGPIPIVTHLHGAHVPAVSDGYPEAWYMPDAVDVDGYTPRGPNYGSVHPAPDGAAVFEYPNDQRATTLWYHDHTLGITRLNVYAGLAGFWILRDDVEDNLNLPGPAPRLDDPPGTRYYEIPIVIQDRSFKPDGSLFYPSSRAFFDEYPGPYFPDSPVPPIWNPEFFGNTIVVNGRTWPYLEVEPRLYRFRLLNGANSRFLLLRFEQDLPFHQIGNEGGLLPDAPLTVDELLLAPAERADVIVDFSKFQPGEQLTLLNLGPDAPFATLPVDPDEQADAETTGQVMQFRIVPLTDQGNPGSVPDSLPPIEQLTTSLPARDLQLNEKVYIPADIPIEAQMGTGEAGPLDWEDDITEIMTEGDVEIWRLANLTEDAHPIHLHLVQFQVLDRVPFDAEAYQEEQRAYLAGEVEGGPPDPLAFATGDPVAPRPWEWGWKDTVIASPGMVTRIISRFDIAGLYVWHCHILEHEDNEMMRPFFVRAQP
jgi:spore coat protein A